MKLKNDIKRKLRDLAEELPDLKHKGPKVIYAVRGDTIKDLSGRDKTEDDEPLDDNLRYQVPQPREVDKFKVLKNIYKQHGWEGVNKFVAEVKEMQTKRAGVASSNKSKAGLKASQL